ncbi:MAG: leucine-rich repeat protein [Coriobacteriia bacterium]|nr:leucine-rich repeat protein [Coriobacteriia bacterium]
MSKLKKFFKLIIIPTSAFFLVGLFFVTSFAMNGNNDNPITKLQRNDIQSNSDINDEVGNFTELQYEFNSAAGSVLTLQKDYRANDSEDGIEAFFDITLDLNGHTIDRALREPRNHGYVIKSFHKLTIVDNNNQGHTGLITGGNNDSAGGGIICSSSESVLTIKGENVLIGGNHSKMDGGAIYCSCKNIDIQNCRIGGKIGDVVYGNSANSSGGAICCDSLDCSISGGCISQNTSSRGGAIAMRSTQSSLHMTGGIITENVANDTSYGGAIYCEGNFDMTGGEISNNTAKEGGGVYAASGSINGENAKIIDNKADKGGAIFLNTGTFNIVNGFIGENGKPNIATQEGGGIFNKEATLNISGGSISYNECKSENQDCYGGGIVNKTTTAKTNITGGIFTNNKCDSSSGAYGGAICVNEGECSISGTSVDISGNISSKYGGAAYLERGSLNLNNCTIGKENSPNMAIENGAGVYVATDVTGAHFKIAGNVDISNNKKTNNSSSNVYLDTYMKIEIDEVGIGENLKVGVFCKEEPTIGNPVMIVEGHGDDYKKFLSDYDGYETINEGGKIYLAKDWMSFEKLQTLLNDASTDPKNPTIIKLYNDVVALSTEEGLNVPEDKYITLDLNGFKIDRSLTSPSFDGHVILNKGNLTLVDTNTRGHIGLITGGNTEGHGGGIYSYGNSVLTINGEHILIGGNHSEGNGGAIFADGKVVVEKGQIGGKIQETVYKNTSSSWGGGIYGTFQSNLSINGGYVSCNSAVFGGGICSAGQNFTMTGGEISNNTAEQGGGVYATSGKINGENVKIFGNKADLGGGICLGSITSGAFYIQGGTIGEEGKPNIAKQGGGIYQSPEIKLDINIGSISYNEAKSDADNLPSYGGGIFSNGSTSITGNVIISNNKCCSETQQSAGGAVYVGGGTCYIAQIEISGNASDMYGGGIYLGAGSLSLDSDCKIGKEGSPNTADENGGGVYVATSAADSHFKIGNGVNIINNTNTDNSLNNVYLAQGRFMEIVEGKEFGENLKVGVTCQQTPTEENPVLIVNGHENDYKKFLSDNKDYEAIRKDGKIYLANYKENPNANWKNLQDNINKGDDVTLTEDIVFDWSREDYTGLVVPSEKTVNLNLNGFSINANLKEAIDDGYVIKNEGNLTITDGTITGGFSTTEGAGICSKGKLTVSGNVIIRNNKSKLDGQERQSNVYVDWNEKRDNCISASGLSNDSYIGVADSSGCSWDDSNKFSDAEVGYAKFFHVDENEGSIATYSTGDGAKDLYLSSLKSDAEGYINSYVKKIQPPAELKIPYTINAVNITGIAGSVFENDEYVSSVDIPETITSIGSGAFSGCTKLTKFNINGNNPNYVAGQVGKNYPMLLSKASNAQTLYAYPSATGDIEIPEAITNLDAKAFEGCENLTSVFFKGDRPEDEGLNALAGQSLIIKYYLEHSWYDKPKPEGKASWNPIIKSNDDFEIFLSNDNLSGETAGVNEDLDFSSKSGKVLTVKTTINKQKTVKFGDSVSLNIGNNAIELQGAQLNIEGGKISNHTVASKSFTANENTNVPVDPDKLVKEPDWAINGSHNTMLQSSNSNAVATISDGTVIHNMKGSTLSIKNTIFEYNTITYGSIYNNGTLLLDNCKFYNNNSVYDGTEYVAGGACLFNSGTATVANTNFGDSTHENKAVLYGGAIANISNLNLLSCLIYNCSAKFGGGIFNSRNAAGTLKGVITIRSSIIDHNKAGGDGVACAGAGILCVNGVDLTLGEDMDISTNKRGKDYDNICLGRSTEGSMNLIKFMPNFSTLGTNKIGITTETKPTSINNILICNQTADFADMLESDNDAYAIEAYEHQIFLRLKNQLKAFDNMVDKTELHSAIDKANKKFDMNKTIDSAKSLYGNIVDKFRVVLGKKRS